MGPAREVRCTARPPARTLAAARVRQRAARRSPEQRSSRKRQRARPAGSDWKVFEGAWFRIDYPPDFEPRPSLKSETGPGYDSAFFRSADGKAEFYVCSPQWGRQPTDIAIDERREKLVAEKSSEGKDRSIRWWTIAAADGSYSRSYESTSQYEGTSYWVFGFRYADDAAYARFLAPYRKFKSTLDQRAD